MRGANGPAGHTQSAGRFAALRLLERNGVTNIKIFWAGDHRPVPSISFTASRDTCLPRPSAVGGSGVNPAENAAMHESTNFRPMPCCVESPAPESNRIPIAIAKADLRDESVPAKPIPSPGRCGLTSSFARALGRETHQISACGDQAEQPAGQLPKLSVCGQHQGRGGNGE